MVDGGQLFVGGFQFFLRSFQFLIDALQFLVGGSDFFVGRLEFFVSCLVLLLEGLGVVAVLGQRAFEFGDTAGFVWSAGFYPAPGAGAWGVFGLLDFGCGGRLEGGLFSLLQENQSESVPL